MRRELRRGDFLERAGEIPSSSCDLIIADPPYYRIKGDFDFNFRSVNHYVDWMKKVIVEVARIGKPSCSFYLWGAIGVNTGFPLFKVVDWTERENLFQVINWITQRNSRGMGQKRGFMMAREELVFFVRDRYNYTWNGAYTRERSTRTDRGANGKPRTNTHKRCSDVWIDIAEASQSSNQRFYFPSGKPFATVKAIALCERIIKASSNPGDNILIPFAGSGSECVAAERLGRGFVAFERDIETFRLAKRRILSERGIAQ